MTFGGKTHDLLAADEAVKAIVVGRIFPAALPQGVTLPAIRYAVVSDVERLALEGDGPRNARVQVDCYAKRYGDAQALADAIAGALSAKSEGLVSLLLSRRDVYEDETGLHGVSLDFSQWMTEA